MNWEFIEKYLPMYEKAALLTVKIGIVGILFAILVGLICAAVQYYKVPVLRWIVTVYVELSRNTPLLVQLFFIGLSYAPTTVLRSLTSWSTSMPCAIAPCSMFSKCAAAQPRQPMPALTNTSTVSGYFWTTSRMLMSFVIAIMKIPPVEQYKIAVISVTYTWMGYITAKRIIPHFREMN